MTGLLAILTLGALLGSIFGFGALVACTAVLGGGLLASATVGLRKMWRDCEVPATARALRQHQKRQRIPLDVDMRGGR